MKFREVVATDDKAVRLLTAYFTSRELSFPSSQGHYRITFPAKADFEPPTGVFFLIINDNETAVGCGGVRRVADSALEEIRYEIKHLWLEPDARGQGWATMLMRELESRARSFGASQVVLDTNHSLIDAARLYKQLGYVEIEPYNDNPNATNWYAKRLD